MHRATLFNFVTGIIFLIAEATVADDALTLGNPKIDRSISKDKLESLHTWERYRACRACWQGETRRSPEFIGCGSWCSSMRLLVE